MNPMKFGMAMSEQRMKSGYEQKQLAAKVGVSRETMNNIETGLYFPRLPIMVALCKAMGCSIDSIVEKAK